MHRQGADPANIQMADVLCDFCAQPWTDARPMVEGHRGSCICGPCLTVAWTELVTVGPGDPATGNESAPDGEPTADGEPSAQVETCALCLEPARDRPRWRSPIRPTAAACLRCVKQAAGIMHKDPDIEWSKPG